MMCPTFFNFVGAFIERPRANTVRPYEASKNLINQGLLQRLFDRNRNRNGHSHHGVVTCADESHHLDASVAFAIASGWKAAAQKPCRISVNWYF